MTGAVKEDAKGASVTLTSGLIMTLNLKHGIVGKGESVGQEMSVNIVIEAILGVGIDSPRVIRLTMTLGGIGLNHQYALRSSGVMNRAVCNRITNAIAVMSTIVIVVTMEMSETVIATKNVIMIVRAAKESIAVGVAHNEAAEIQRDRLRRSVIHRSRTRKDKLPSLNNNSWWTS
jgi:hypothetical protein